MNQGKEKSVDDRSKTKSDISRNQVHQVINALYYSYSNLETNQRTTKHLTSPQVYHESLNMPRPPINPERTKINFTKSLDVGTEFTNFRQDSS